MEFDPAWPVESVRTRWRALERDWQSVVIGSVIVVLVVLFEIPIPW